MGRPRKSETASPVLTAEEKLVILEKEKKELEILKEYLPPELSAEEIKKIIEEAILSTGAQDTKDIGKVMKEVTAKVSGQADNKLVSDLVRERLSRPSTREAI